MAVGIPSQRHRCPTYEWCTERAAGHKDHVGEIQVLTTAQGHEIRVSLIATGDKQPVVQVEASFDHPTPMMEVAEMDPAEAVELAGFLLRLARVAQGSGEGVR